MTVNNHLFDTVDINKYGQVDLFMRFSLGNRHYIMPAKQISEVMKLPALYTLGQTPSYVMGILNLRGNIINIIDIREKLGLMKQPYSIDTCLLVVQVEGASWGLIVDSVDDVLSIDLNTVISVPYAEDNNNSMVKGVVKHKGGILILLNLDYINKMLPHLDDDKSIQNTELPLVDENLIYIQPNLFDTGESSRLIFEERAKNLQSELKENVYENHETTHIRFVTFLLNNETYCIPLHDVKEFGNLTNFSPIPCVPDFIIGLLNLRGEFYVLIDIKTFLGIKSLEINDKSKVILINSTSMNLGLVVDEVFDIITIPTASIHKSGLIKSEGKTYSSGEIVLENNKVVTVFDIEKFMKDERLIVEDAI